ncbi:UDP-N-acetylmuramate--L-alanine ligase [uncultured Algibacter sp.]|uniref:UDP-N-acetylmuramate--L-alanine ligase n=1 Tax=uncultured Algibacter sp. TaxID=298659 RepID=UPI003216279C
MIDKEVNIPSTKQAFSSESGLRWDNIYFIGIGGIGMSALARYFFANNKLVSGYDKTPTAITDGLVGMGISVHFEDAIAHIDARFLNLEKTLVVYTPAIPENHKELMYFINHGYKVLKRSQVLGLITENTYCLAIAGTHGKTTTTSILGHLMNQCQVPLTAFLGGISENYNSNLILNGAEVSVVEADEFDRSFLTLSPNLACITSMDADHLDIYGNASELEKSFKDFLKKIKPNGKLFVRNGLPLNGITYGIEDDSNYTIQNIRIKNGCYVFNVKTPTQVWEDLEFSLPGRHNLLNALAALSMAIEYGCDKNTLIKALASYKGVKRRFTYQIKTEDLVFIDDYAHHPEEINAVHQAVREMYPNKRVLAIFQPHLYTRTRDFINEFAKSLSQFDELLLLDIYPAREMPIQGVTSSWLLEKVNNKNKQLVKKDALLTEIKKSEAQVILTIGAGDIGEQVKYIKKELSIAN